MFRILAEIDIPFKDLLVIYNLRREQAGLVRFLEEVVGVTIKKRTKQGAVEVTDTAINKEMSEVCAKING